MHHGLINAAASFQHFMNDVFKNLLEVCVVVYLDHLVYSENHIHTTHVLEVLCRLRTNNLDANVDKWEFDVNTTNFIGFIISPDGLQWMTRRYAPVFTHYQIRLG